MTSETRKKKRREHQRREILAAARELILSDGVEGFSMRKLARKLECSPGTLYIYFKDKHALLALLVDESFERLMEALDASIAGQGAMPRLRRIMEAYVDFGLAHPDLYHFAFMLRRTEQLEKARPQPHRSYDLLRKTIKECMDLGLLREMELERATQGLWSGLHGITSLIVTMPHFPWSDKDELIQHVLDSALGSLSATPETE